MKGKVYLVGAGPGDPSLITKRGWDLVHRAEVLVVDDLVHSLFSHLNSTADIIYAGKRGPAAPGGRVRALSQSAINRQLVKLARAGKFVVRLKGGDPLVFGRGGEEMEALRKARIPFEVVPGVTSPVAAAAYAGIPVSDRRWASSVTFVTGQESPPRRTRPSASLTEKSVARVDWSRLPVNGTLVVLMGVHRWPVIRKTLLNQGWSALTPVCAVKSATWVGHRNLITNLGDSVQAFRKAKISSPSIFIIGDVVRSSRRLAWLQREKPLLGKVVVITRSANQNREFRALLEDKGAVVVECPAIALRNLPLDPLARRRLEDWKQGHLRFDWVVFLSENAVKSFAEAAGPLRPWPSGKVAAVGPTTAAAVQALGWPVHRIAKKFEGAGLLSDLGSLKGKHLLVPRVQNAPPDFFKNAERRGARVEPLSTYVNIPAPPPPARLKSFLLAHADVVTFTSSSTATSFLVNWSKQDRRRLFARALALSIGPQTSATLRQNGVRRIQQASVSTTEGMVQALIRKMGR